jgi:hypothetical protein
MIKTLPPFFGLILFPFLLCSCPDVHESDDLGIEVEGAKIISHRDISGYPPIRGGYTGFDIAVDADSKYSGRVYVRQNNILYQLNYYNNKVIIRNEANGFPPPKGLRFLDGSGMAVFNEGAIIIPCYQNGGNFDRQFDSILVADAQCVFYKQYYFEDLGIDINEHTIQKLRLGRNGLDDNTLWLWIKIYDGEEIYFTVSYTYDSNPPHRGDFIKLEKIFETTINQPFDCTSVAVTGTDVWYSRRGGPSSNAYYERFIWKSDLHDVSTELKTIKITSEKEIISSAVVVPVAYENSFLWVVVGDKVLCLEP